jgi:hypothetical protein
MYMKTFRGSSHRALYLQLRASTSGLGTLIYVGIHQKGLQYTPSSGLETDFSTSTYFLCLGADKDEGRKALNADGQRLL